MVQNGVLGYDRVMPQGDELQSFVPRSELSFQLRTYSWYDRGLPQGDELQSFVRRYEASFRCAGAAGKIEETRR